MADEKILMYNGHPLRRADNLIYYGSMADKYIVMMQVLDSEPLKDISLAKRVSIQLQLTSPNLKSRDRVVRSDYFTMDRYALAAPEPFELDGRSFRVLFPVRGALLVRDGDRETPVPEGRSCLLPAALGRGSVAPADASAGAELLSVEL